MGLGLNFATLYYSTFFKEENALIKQMMGMVCDMKQYRVEHFGK